MNKKEMINCIKRMTPTATDEVALDSIGLYKTWKPDIEVIKDERRQHEGILYRCVQSHTTQTGWEPDKTPALWVVVSLEEYPDWVRPEGEHDAYPKGAKVTYKEKRWVSVIDKNVWKPDDYGWIN